MHKATFQQDRAKMMKAKFHKKGNTVYSGKYWNQRVASVY